jgi:hypothetical protein
MSFQQELKQHVPPTLWNAWRASWYWLNRTAQLPSATFHPWRRASKERLAAYKNLHQGKRCFIIGNGPSLKQTDLSRLRGEYTFGLNRIYLMFPELGFNTTYYLCVNDLVIEQTLQDILALSIPIFLCWRSRRFFNPKIFETLSNSNLPIFLHTTYSGPKFAQDVRSRLWEGATVTYVALQMAFHMGFTQVFLIGVDHNYQTKGKPNTTIVSHGDDPNHFNSNYFGKGFRWQLPDLDTNERAYHLARLTFEQAGRQIVDATIDGKLTVFPKVAYDSLF